MSLKKNKKKNKKKKQVEQHTSLMKQLRSVK